jgi:hypothetical protein
MRSSLLVESPDHKKFLCVGLHGFFWVASVDDFNCMPQV